MSCYVLEAVAVAAVTVQIFTVEAVVLVEFNPRLCIYLEQQR
jgi:hypothetical protein